MECPASHEDVAIRWRPLTSAEQAVSQVLLGDAWEILQVELPATVERLEADPPTLSVALVRAVLARVVIRVLRNPNAIRQQSVEDFSQTLDVEAASGELRFTEADLALLSAGAASAAGDAFTITPYYEPPESLLTVDSWT